MCLKKSAAKTVKNAASFYDKCDSAFKGYKKGNPLMMRKKLSVTDVVFRKDDPDTDVFKLELSYDMELYLLIIMLVIALMFMSRKICRIFRRR